MIIAQTRFWIDRDSRQIGIRSSRNGLHPIECWLSRRPSWLDLNFYEDTEDDDSVHVRVSFKLLWLTINAFVMKLSGRENGHKFDDRDQSWGWHFIDRCFVFNWGLKRWSFQLPFITTECEGSQIMSLSRNRVVFDEANRDGSKKDFLGSYAERQKAIDENSATFDYTYEFNNGEKQHLKAKVHVTRHLRRWKWTPFVKHDDSIWVEFTEEVGPERGSWKGGCTGCGWTLRKKETVRACLRRMERDRRFER